MLNSPVKPFKIGGLKLKNNLIAAPMAGITDYPFRVLARAGGAGLVCSEMISSQALIFSDKKTLGMLPEIKDDSPISVQIFGSKPDVMAEAAIIAEKRGADIVDINLGCPAPKIGKSGSGAKLLGNTERISMILEAVVKSIKIPVTVKIRTGITKGENIAPEVARLAEKCGISAVTVHGRPACDRHSGEPDYPAIRETVESVKIPVIGNGGVTDETTAVEFFQKTGCSAVMIGRSCIGDPEIFERIEKYSGSGNLVPGMTWESRIEVLKEHARLSAARYGEKNGVIRLRKIAPYYLKGLPNASRIRQSFNKIVSLIELEELTREIWKCPYFEGADE